MPNYIQGDSRYNPLVPIGGTGQTEGQAYEQTGRDRYAGLLQQLQGSLYDPMKDAQTTQNAVAASGTASLKGMGGKYKNAKFNANDPRYASLYAAIQGNASKQKQGEEDTQRSLTGEIGGANANENVAWDSGGLNSLLMQYQAGVQKDQAKQQNEAATTGAVAGGAGSILSALLKFL